MGNCCLSSSEKVQIEAKKAAQCPCCGTSAKPVGWGTLIHQVVAPLNQQLPPDEFFFCASTDCNTVYFSNGGVVIERPQVRGDVGQKSTNANRVICYCFDIRYAKVLEEIAQTGTSASKAFVVEQTKLQNCACDVRNPSGKCCLKEFPK
ncbi:MAG: hypothetical protein OQK12_03215 [Motiliproteus sp.]|nr:hypothetical protein [Motiliproteus sp.]MCW9051872.1 hypothetical protein [Motiliproteus sp.]